MERFKSVVRLRRAKITLATLIALAALSSSSLAQTTPPIDWNKIDSEALSYFRAYLRFDTTNPPSNTAATIAYLKSILDKEGIATETFESKPGMVSLVARIPGPANVKPLLLMSHADVVPTVAANWTHHPFDADLTDGYVWARGAIDNKAHGIMALMTMLALKRNGVALSRGVEMMVNPDEEAGGENGAAWMVKNHWDAIDPAFAFNEGGEGAPDWLGIKGVTFTVAVSEKRVNWLHITVRGKGGHGSVPKPDNPNLILINALHRLLENQPPIRMTHQATKRSRWSKQRRQERTTLQRQSSTSNRSHPTSRKRSPRIPSRPRRNRNPKAVLWTRLPLLSTRRKPLAGRKSLKYRQKRTQRQN